MKNCLIFLFLLIYSLGYSNPNDSAFIDKCYFSEDGKWVLVSELDFFIPWDNFDRFPVYGLYKLGENEINNRIIMTNDSIYFFNYTFYPRHHNYSVDSVFEINDFFDKYKFSQEGTNVTQSIRFEIDKKFIKKVNTIELLMLNSKYKKHKAADTKYYDYTIQFYYKKSIIFNDTILNSYANKKHLIDGLKEIEKKEIYSKKENSYLGTDGYGTRIYTNFDNSIFFIKAKYDVTNYVKVYSKSKIIHPITNRDKKIKLTVSHSDDPYELRILLTTSR